MMQLGLGPHTPQNNTQSSPNRKSFKGGSPSKSPGKGKVLSPRTVTGTADAVKPSGNPSFSVIVTSNVATAGPKDKNF
jgi:hypothetical protein